MSRLSELPSRSHHPYWDIRGYIWQIEGTIPPILVKHTVSPLLDHIQIRLYSFQNGNNQLRLGPLVVARLGKYRHSEANALSLLHYFCLLFIKNPIELDREDSGVDWREGDEEVTGR
jgi:hypothetical protein